MQNDLTKSPEIQSTPTEGAQAVSLDSPGVASALSARIKRDINDYAIKTYYEPHRWHLGASLIGHECSRYLWFVFRWAGRMLGAGFNDEERHNNLGRMQRLFNRGHREEERYVEYLKGIGCEVWTHDKDGNQFRMSAVGGHYGGSLDGIVRFPARYKIEEPLLVEFKTVGTGKGFNDLAEKSLAIAKPQHFSQMSTYGNEYKLRYGCYFNTNKNDDDIYVEVVKLNWGMAEQFKAKAERIIRSQEPPPRISESPTTFACKYCDFVKVCHHAALPERNCRSCQFARPVPGAEWFCNAHNAQIPRIVIPLACPSYKAIVNA